MDAAIERRNLRWRIAEMTGDVGEKKAATAVEILNIYIIEITSRSRLIKGTLSFRYR